METKWGDKKNPELVVSLHFDSSSVLKHLEHVCVCFLPNDACSRYIYFFVLFKTIRVKKKNCKCFSWLCFCGAKPKLAWFCEFVCRRRWGTTTTRCRCGLSHFYDRLYLCIILYQCHYFYTGHSRKRRKGGGWGGGEPNHPIPQTKRCLCGLMPSKVWLFVCHSLFFIFFPFSPLGGSRPFFPVWSPKGSSDGSPNYLVPSSGLFLCAFVLGKNTSTSSCRVCVLALWISAVFLCLPNVWAKKKSVLFFVWSTFVLVWCLFFLFVFCFRLLY